MDAVRIISIFIIFISVFGLIATYTNYQSISQTVTDFENSINTAKLDMKTQISSTIDDTSNSLNSASKSLELASSSTYMAGEAAYQASDDFHKISKILSTITFGLFNPAKKYEDTLGTLGDELKSTAENLNLTAQKIKKTKDNIEDFKEIGAFTTFLEDTSDKVNILRSNMLFLFVSLFLQQFVNLLIGISLYIISQKKTS